MPVPRLVAVPAHGNTFIVQVQNGSSQGWCSFASEPREEDREEDAREEDAREEDAREEDAREEDDREEDDREEDDREEDDREEDDRGAAASSCGGRGEEASGSVGTGDGAAR